MSMADIWFFFFLRVSLLFQSSSPLTVEIIWSWDTFPKLQLSTCWQRYCSLGRSPGHLFRKQQRQPECPQEQRHTDPQSSPHKTFMCGSRVLTPWVLFAAYTYHFFPFCGMSSQLNLYFICKATLRKRQREGRRERDWKPTEAEAK